MLHSAMPKAAVLLLGLALVLGVGCEQPKPAEVSMASSQATPTTQYTADQLHQRTLERRAVEAAIWGMPLVNVDAMRQPYLRAGAKYNDAIYWSKANTWMNQTTTPNHSTSYVIFFTNLKDGPVVVEI